MNECGDPVVLKMEPGDTMEVLCESCGALLVKIPSQVLRDTHARETNDSLKEHAVIALWSRMVFPVLQTHRLDVHGDRSKPKISRVIRFSSRTGAWDFPNG